MKSYLVLLLLLFPSFAFSSITFDVSGKWETTFDCPPQAQGGYNCDGLNSSGGWSCSDASGSHPGFIGSVANQVSGLGGLGFRQMVGDGQNNNSGGISTSFSAPQKELWIRTYMRYENGFNWDSIGYHKNIRLDTNSTTNTIAGLYPASSRKLGLYREGPSEYPVSSRNISLGWDDVYPLGVSDGTWFAVEIYLKMDTVVGGISQNDGISRFWVNGVLNGENTNFNWSGGGGAIAAEGWTTLAFGGNQNRPANGACVGVDFDDIVVYNQTPPNVDAQGNPFIGPIGWDGEPVASEPVSPPPTQTAPTPTTGMPAKAEVLLAECFSDNNWSSRGWYDGTNSTGVTSGGYSGTALRWNWASSATQPGGFSVLRRPFPATDEFLIEYYVKFEDGWQGSGLNWHPHLIHVLSTDDTQYQALARANSGLYFESLASGSNYLQFAHQDFLRSNTSYGTPVVDLTSATEMRSTNQCNTPYQRSGASFGTCYNDGVGWYSANTWRSSGVTIPAGQWVKITGHVKKNTFTAGVANFDGIVRLWVDDQLAIESNSVQYAAGAYSDTQWDKLVLAPYIGNGSPVNQTMWLDELRIWSIAEGPSSTVAPPPLLQLVQ